MTEPATVIPEIDRSRRNGKRPSLLGRMWRNMISLHGSPREVALGAALGMFLAFTPTFGIQLFLALIITSLIRASRPAALITVWVTNIFTIAPIYAFCYWLGAFIWPADATFHEAYSKLSQLATGAAGAVTGEWWQFWTILKSSFAFIGYEMYMPMLIGGLIVGLVTGAITYFIVLKGVLRYRRMRARLRHRIRELRRHHRKQHAAGKTDTPKPAEEHQESSDQAA